MKGLHQVLLLGLLAAPGSAYAHDIPVNTVDGLIRNCTLSDPSQDEIEFHTGLCLGFIKGVSNYMATEAREKKCPPPAIENGDLIESVVSLGKVTQKSMGDAPSVFLVRIAMERLFACKSDTLPKQPEQ